MLSTPYLGAQSRRTHFFLVEDAAKGKINISGSTHKTQMNYLDYIYTENDKCCNFNQRLITGDPNIETYNNKTYK